MAKLQSAAIALGFTLLLTALAGGVSTSDARHQDEVRQLLQTSTATRTPTPTPTPTLTPTPAPPCSWNGTWNTVANQEAFRMELAQSGVAVTGTYGTEPRRIEGIASGNQLQGRWAGPPAFREPLNAGRFVFTITADCSSYTGTWGFDTSSTNGGAWAGVRALPQPPPPSAAERIRMVSDLYRMVLCREPDSTGLVSWSSSDLTEEQIRAGLTASPEGQRVRAVGALYLSELARDAIPGDCRGLRGWVDSDLTLPQIRAGLAGSQEGQRVVAVRDLYLELLGRDPLGRDNPGLRSWVDSSLSLEDIRRGIMASPEYRRRRGG